MYDNQITPEREAELQFQQDYDFHMQELRQKEELAAAIQLINDNGLRVVPKEWKVS